MGDQPLPIHGIHHPGDTRPAHPPDRVAPYVMREGIAYVGGRQEATGERARESVTHRARRPPERVTYLGCGAG